MKYIPLSLLLCICCLHSPAQQFVGLQSSQLPGISQLNTDPTLTTEAQDGLQLQPFSLSILAGTNAYHLKKEAVTGGLSDLVEGRDYYKDEHDKSKHLWGNVDIMGPAASFAVKDNNFGVYMRLREIIRAGNISSSVLGLIGDLNPAVLGKPLELNKSGFTVNSFAEFGFNYGRVLLDDLYRKVSVGVTVKYIMGMTAGSIYTQQMKAGVSKSDSTLQLQGNLSIAYTDGITDVTDRDASNDLSAAFNRSGKGTLGLDIGISYEYRPDGDPNQKSPYLYRVSAAITDIGSINYKADSGSAQYQVQLNNLADWQYKKLDYESYVEYLGRMQKLGILNRVSETKEFRVGLPTALRLNGDYRFTPTFYMSCNILLNLKGSSDDVYNPAYVNYFALTPRYEKKGFMIGLPFTYLGYQTATLGTIFRLGPLYVGSSSILSCLMAKELKSADVYAGLAFRLPHPGRQLK